MVQPLIAGAPANLRSTAGVAAPKQRVRNNNEAAFEQLRELNRISDPLERRAALEALADKVQLNANLKARGTWREYRIWRNELSLGNPVKGLYTPQKERYRVALNPEVPGALQWLGMPFQSYLNALNSCLKRAGSSVVVQSKHKLILQMLWDQQTRIEMGVKRLSEESECPICGGDLVLGLPEWVGGVGHVARPRCWHEGLDCNDHITRALWREGTLPGALRQWKGVAA